MDNRILVTGGTGLIGKYLQNEMPKASYVGSSDYNLTKNDEVIKMFKDIREIDGFLIGGASKSSKKFIDIIKNYYR